MKIECEQCHEEGYLQQLGNYFRVRHYAGMNPKTGKSKFIYHQQSKPYALSQLAGNGKRENFIEQSNIEQLTTGQEPNLKDSSFNSSGLSLVWLGHQLPKLTTRVQIPATAPQIIQAPFRLATCVF